jgi:hypothetical protein
MVDFGKILWETKTRYNTYSSSAGADTFEYFLNYCKAKLPSQNLNKSYEIFLAERKRLQGEMKTFSDTIAVQPLLTGFLAWVKEILVLPNVDLNLAKILLENGLIGINDKEGEVWTIAKAKEFDHQSVIDAIRCRSEWPTTLREDLVMAYVIFIQWLSSVTYGYIDKIEDPDQLRTQARALPYPLFLNFISHLKDKDRLVAKMLYFGGNRALEDILDLKIEEVDFENRFIYFNTQPITYPLHIFADVKALVKDRQKGRIFLGRQNTPLNAATIFRNFKDAATASGMGQNFTPKVLLINR